MTSPVWPPNAPALLTDGFGGAFWWAVAIGAVAILPVLILPRHPSAKDYPAG
jgi:hypothetical protein